VSGMALHRGSSQNESTTGSSNPLITELVTMIEESPVSIRRIEPRPELIVRPNGTSC